MTPTAPLWDVADQLAPGRAALIVVDLQNDFTHPDGQLATRNGVDVALARARFDQVTRLVQGARDGAVPVIWLAVIHDVTKEPANYLAAQLPRPSATESIRAEDLLTHRGTWGSAWDSALPAPLEGEPSVEKPGYNGFHRTRLTEVLEELGATTLIFCGCNTNVCIQATAAEGFARGFYTILASDACAALDGEPAHEAALATHRKYYGHALTTSEILHHWRLDAPLAGSSQATS